MTDPMPTRRRIGRPLLAVAAALYAVALVALALAPGPARAACADAQGDVRRIVDGIPIATAPGHPLTDPAVLSLLVGFVAFLPLGVLLRLSWGRGVVVALAAGFGLSVLVEATQFTGAWGAAACPYRVADVVDVLAGTLGAVVGSAIALIFVRPDGRDAAPVTRVRRALGMTGDWVSVYFLGFVLTTPVAAAVLLLAGDSALASSDAALDIVQTTLALAVTGAVALGTGRTIGDHSVRIAFTGGPLPRVAAVPVRFVAGIGGYQLLTAPTEGANPVSLAFVVASIVLVFTTARGRGLPGLASRQEVVDARERA